MQPEIFNFGFDMNLAGQAALLVALGVATVVTTRRSRVWEASPAARLKAVASELGLHLELARMKAVAHETDSQVLCDTASDSLETQIRVDGEWQRLGRRIFLPRGLVLARAEAVRFDNTGHTTRNAELLLADNAGGCTHLLVLTTGDVVITDAIRRTPVSLHPSNRPVRSDRFSGEAHGTGREQQERTRSRLPRSLEYGE